ncbi:hypothetical protein RB195_000097 [Necator americanus]|uniref:DM domain-containing protein n=1 Tax=Necator americanus TaxID=51031 RepID=A0ABR1D8S9_NECAM
MLYSDSRMTSLTLKNGELGTSPTSSMPTPTKSRVLYCRKCEGHGEKVILKNHAPNCPYILCTCRSCEKLNYKRLKSFNKRNKEKLELAAALNAQRRAESGELTEEESFEYYERVTGLYRDLRWLANVSSHCFSPPRQVLEDQFIDPAGMKRLLIKSIPFYKLLLNRTIHPRFLPRHSFSCWDLAKNSHGTYFPSEGSRRSSFSSCADSPGTSTASMDGEPARKQSSSTRTGLEGRSMSLGAMTVMSYDIWKAKCAAEKKRLEAEGKSSELKIDDDQPSSSPPARKRAHTFVARDEPKEIPKVSPPNAKEKKGRYILLPTIPAVKVFVGEDAPAIVPTEPSSIPLETSVSTTAAPTTVPALSVAPTLPLQNTLPRPSPIAVTAPNFFNHLSNVTPVAPVAPTSTTSAFGAGLTADQLLASLLPSSMLLQNAGLLQQNALAGLLGLAAAPALAPPPTSCASDVLALLRAQQSAQLAAALAAPAKNSLLPSSTPDDLIQSLLAQTRQPIFSHSL